MPARVRRPAVRRRRAPTNFMVLTPGHRTSPVPTACSAPRTTCTSATNHDHARSSTRTRPIPRIPRTRCSCASTRSSARPPVATGRLLTGPGDGMATWADMKAQAGDDARHPARRTWTCSTCRCWRPTRTATSCADPTASRRSSTPRAASRRRRPGRGTVHRAAPIGTSLLRCSTGHGVPRRHCPHARADRARVPRRQSRTRRGAQRAPAPTTTVLLGQHFMAGDGRVNENIGLTTVHHVFHSEHNRLQGDIDSMITNFAATGLTRPRRTTGVRTPRAPAGTTASGCSRPPGSSPRWSTSTWCSRSSPARCSRW